MASSMANPNPGKPNMHSNPSQKVRIIGKIRGFTDQESGSLDGVSTPWMFVGKPNEHGSSDKVTISFGDQPASRKDTYELDYCYEQSEDIGVIFSKEIQPLISGVFDGQNASIIAYGARRSGKTYTIQGCEEKPGLATLAMAEILSMAEGIGKFVTVSFYEVFQDHIYDILDPKCTKVQVLEDAHGKIKLKGISRVHVKSMSEFHKLYYSGCNSLKPPQKIALELPRKSHKGLMINVLSHDENLNTKFVGKMNFVDLAGYEDVRRNSSDGTNLVESTRINKSLYALTNVVYALNANESRVPYRESKLTRVLQDSLGGTNHVLMLTCLNPFFCQDTIYTLSLASRSCQGINRILIDSTKKSKSSVKPVVPSLQRNGKLATGSSAAKKQTSSRVHLSEKKANCIVKGRKLFDDGNQLISSKQAKTPSKNASAIAPDIASVIVPSLQEEERSISDASLATTPKEDKILLSSPIKEAEPIITVEKDVSSHSVSNHIKVTPVLNSDNKALTLFKDKNENKSLVINEDGSPPLSARLRELSNNLKSLYSSTPCVKKLQEIDIPSSGQVICTDIVDPITPIPKHDVRFNDKWEIAKFNSPSETFYERSSGMKHTLVQDYLQFLNSATKEELKGLRGIGEKRATYIVELREEAPEPFKSLEDLQDIGLSAKQIKGMMKNVAGELFS